MKQRDFLEEWRKRMKKVDKEIWGDLEEKIRIAAAKPDPFDGILYNIHKRSLPVGLDKPMVWNLTEEQANQWILRYTKTHLRDVRESDSKTMVYFEKVKQDGAKHNVFENEKETIKNK